MITEENPEPQHPAYPSGDDFAEYEVSATGARVVASLIPIPGVNALIGEAMASVLRVPLSRRLDGWAASIDKRLRTLETEHGVDLEELAASDEFVTVMLHATQAALRSHEREKLDALRAAVTNAALQGEPDVDQRLIFTRWVDELTASHMAVLRFLLDPRGAVEERADAMGTSVPPIGNQLEALGFMYPEFQDDRRELAMQLARDLDARGLTTTAGWGGAYLLSTDWSEVVVTDLGKDFVAFITDPLPNDPAESPTPPSGS